MIRNSIRHIGHISVTLIIPALLVAACGSGAVRQTPVQLSPAESIDPFAYGDEFAVTVPGNADGISDDTSDTTPGGADTVPGSIAPVTPLPRSTTVPDGVVYRVQLGGVFENREEAESYARRARNRIDGEVTVEYRPPFYRVYAGNFASQRDAEAYIQIISQQGISESRWVPERPTAR